MVLAYWKFTQSHFIKNGKPTSQLGLIKRSLKPLRELYGNEAAADFGPTKLKAVRETFVAKGFTRNTCNENTARIKRLFSWGVQEQLVAETVYRTPRPRSGAQERPLHGSGQATRRGPVDPQTTWRPS